jgi:L-arabinonolactonase
VFGGAGLNELYITTARQDMSSDELALVPEAGSVYRAVIYGVRGLPDAPFAD